jgi:hypothetical protein
MHPYTWVHWLETVYAAHFMAAVSASEMDGYWMNLPILTLPSFLCELKTIGF